MRTARKSEKTKRPSTKREKIEISRGNVFADLGFEHSEERLLKAKLASKIAQLIEQKGWTQAQTAARTALDQPKLSRLLRGQQSGFSADRLFAVLNRLGHSIEVRISAKERVPEKSHTRVHDNLNVLGKDDRNLSEPDSWTTGGLANARH